MADKKPSLVYVINSFTPGGAELGLLTLVRRGFFAPFDLTVIGLAKGAGFIYDELVALLGSERVLFFSDRTSPPDYLIPHLSLQLLRQFKKRGADITVLSLPQSILCGRLAALFMSKMCVVCFEHSSHRRRKIADVLLKLTAFRTDMVWTDSTNTGKSTQKLYPPHLRIRTYDVPLVLFDDDQPPHHFSSEQPYRFLSMGRLNAEKNYDNLVQAANILVKKGFPVFFDVAGEGPDKNYLESLVRTVGLSQHFRFLGFVKEIDALFSQYSYYIQPSLFEGLAISVLQAMARGLLVIASDVGQITHYGKDGKNMVKIEGASAATIAEAIERVLSLNANDVLEIKEEGRRTALFLYGTKAVKAKWDAALHPLLTMVQDQNRNRKT